MCRNTTRSHRRGVAMAYVVVAISVGLAIASIAVDYGRVQIAKTQLRVAADAAARAAVTQLGTTVANVQNTAAQYAAFNTCDGQAVTIDKNNDVEFIEWDPNTRTATVLNGAARNYANAVRITCKRHGDDGIPLTFAWMGGRYHCNATGVAIAAMVPPGYGLVGIDFISLKGNSSASYWSSTGSVSGNAGNIASNGNITSTGNSTISGTVWALPEATVSGITANARRNLTSPLSFPNGNASPYGPADNDNSLLPSGAMIGSGISMNNKNLNFPGGNYYVDGVSLSSNSSINFLGPATIYCHGTINISGSITTYNSIPANLKIITVPHHTTGNAPGSITIGSNTATRANIYAPQSPITLSGNGALYGQIIGKSITMTGTSDIYYDLSFAGGNGVVQIVK